MCHYDVQDSRVCSLEAELSDARNELIRLRSVNLSVSSKDELIESLKAREIQLKDKVSRLL